MRSGSAMPRPVTGSSVIEAVSRFRTTTSDHSYQPKTRQKMVESTLEWERQARDVKRTTILFNTRGETRMTRASLNRLITAAVAMAITVVPGLASASTDNGTLTAGTENGSCLPPEVGTYHVIGFINGASGSYSPTGLTGGRTLAGISDVEPVSCGSHTSAFSVTGFSSNPGSAWLSSVTCNGVERLQSSAISYTYTSSTGTAAWIFSGNFGFAGGDQYACSIVHS
jgi:hypothetical protein